MQLASIFSGGAGDKLVHSTSTAWENGKKNALQLFFVGCSSNYRDSLVQSKHHC